MLARTPKSANDKDGDDDVQVFWPLIGLSVLSAGWAGFCWYLRGQVTDAGVIKGMTIMAAMSAGATVLWIALAAVNRPKR